jgi:hypothetical protein
MFSMTPEDQVRQELSRPQSDVSTGAWHRKHADLLQMPELDLGYRLLIAEVPRSTR